MSNDATTKREAWEQGPIRPGALVGLGVAGVGMGALLGGLTNAANGLVSPEYFRAVLRWGPEVDAARASVAQGIFEGLLFGFGLSLIFATVVGVAGRARCPLSTSGRYLLAIGGAALACWVAGGLLAMGLATLSPDFYRATFRLAPEGAGPLLRFAWVGGSIMGLQLGGLASVVGASILFWARWRRPPAGTAAA